MKLASQRVATFLRSPGDCRIVLLYGEDVGMIHHRADALIRVIAGSLDDPFLVAELGRGELDRLPDEAASLPLTGGRRVVRVRDATDAATGPVQVVLNSRTQALVVLEAPGLASRSKLRTLLEAAPDGTAIACHPEEGRALEETIRRTLEAATVAADQDALVWLASQLGADQVSTQAELEKLALYAGPNGRVDLDMAMYCVGDTAGLSLEDALFAATAGDLAIADRALELAVAEGAAPVGVLRGGLMHLQRLYRARLLVETGVTASDAAKAARPPVFFRRIGAFTKALSLWSSASLAAAMAGLSQAERNCKRTGAPDHTLSRHAILTLARRATAAR
ncbi:MAG TPA: DNA polymerase III subunit delta [Acetobacteraceae bacterium]|jgi:DNA polymerase-3 subunit delta|nr:DNA polymerase III subunit delta [Acetobacteraceae bacterium]